MKTKPEREEKPRRKLLLRALEAEACMDPGETSGHIHMTMDGSTVWSDDHKKKLGAVYNIIGGGIEINFADGFKYHISLREIWTTVSDAHEKWKKENGR